MVFQNSWSTRRRHLYWDFRITYLIKIISTDTLKENNVDYYIYNRHGIERVADKIAEEIISEYTCMVDNHDGNKTSKAYVMINEEDNDTSV